MNTREALKLAIDGAEIVCDPYLDDLTDEEMMVRPHPKCNHIKWQLGHLIQSENEMISGVVPESMPALPAGFAEKYSRETASSDNPDDFHSKQALLELYRQQRAATFAALAAQSDEQLDRPAPESMRAYAPTVAAAFAMQGTHWLMHAGQWAVIRRQCNREPLF